MDHARSAKIELFDRRRLMERGWRG